MDKEKAKELLAKYKTGTLTDEERALLESWYLDLPVDDELDLSEAELQNELQQVRGGIPYLTKDKRTIRLWPRIAAAASILIFLSIGSHFLLHDNVKHQIAQNQVHDIAPPINKAILTLSNGKKIILNNTNNGLLAQQGNTAINKIANGAIVYLQSANKNSSEALAYNNITIPRGGEYQLVILPDGSKVWLNSASSMRYPTTFPGSERKVEITGEAYFEVEHNPNKPFRVVSNGQTVEVLGTHFNINAYSDEDAIKTTLLQGSVKVTSGTASNIIKPGEQAQFKKGNIKVVAADVDEAVAWKNGQFMFNNDNITYIMRIISRWYDVDVNYSGAIPTNGFYGGISRFKNVSEVLNTLELTGKVHFKIEGRKITVAQ